MKHTTIVTRNMSVQTREKNTRYRIKPRDTVKVKVIKQIPFKDTIGKVKRIRYVPKESVISDRWGEETIDALFKAFSVSKKKEMEEQK